jgi:hypothetical protein
MTVREALGKSLSVGVYDSISEEVDALIELVRGELRGLCRELMVYDDGIIEFSDEYAVVNLYIRCDDRRYRAVARMRVLAEVVDVHEAEPGEWVEPAELNSSGWEEE